MQNNKKSTEQVLARRLRPIYDAVDGAQYKKAIVEADKVLKKHPQTHTAKALKALALIRSDRSSDALVVLNALEKDLVEQEFDENTVQALSHCYKELNNPQRIAALYALLVKRNPGNEQLARELFYSHVRTKNFRQQQQIAMQLYKDTKVSHYYCWALMSVLLQGYNDEKLGTSMFFPLAEKMLEKISLDELHTMAGGIDLHLLVLEPRKKYAEAIGLIESNLKPLGDTHSDEQLRQRADHFYKLAKDGDALTARAIAGIEKDPNELGNWKNLADCLMLHTESDLREEALRNACQIIAHFEEGSPTSDTINFSPAERRGILLGRLMLLKSLFMADIPMEEQRLVDTLLGTPIALLKSLANIVLDKPYGFADLSPFLHLLSADESEQLIGHVETISADEHKNDKIWPSILLEQLKFHFNPPLRLSDEQLDAMVKRATIKFVDEFAVNNSEENGDSAQINGVQMSAYAQLIVQYWWEMCMRKGEGRFEYLIELIAFIEWIYANHPDCTASIPITLCRLYGIFGDISRIETLERQISLKFIQRDSLAFLHFFVPYQFGKFKNANIYYTSLGAMYDMNEREVNECLVSAYKNHCFSQIPKLMEFATRSSKSIFSIGADVLNRCLTGCFAVNSTELAATAFLGDNEPALDWQTVADNRDFSVFPPIIPSQIIEKICDSSLREMRSFFKLKHRLLLAIAQIGTEQMAESANGFFNALEECREQFSESSNDGLEKMLESFVWLRFDQLMAPSNNLLQLPANLLNFATNLSTQQNADEQEKSLEIFEKYLNEVFDFYAKFNLNELSGRIESIRNLAISLEMMAICLIGCKLLAERMAPAQAKSSLSQQPLNGTMPQQAGGGKGEKRKQQQQSKNPHMDPINRRLHLLGQAIRRMHEFISAPEFKNGDNLCKRTVDSENARNFLPKTVQTQIHQILAEQVSPSLDRAISNSTAELTDAICHLLVNHLSVDVQALNIRANK